MSTDDRDQQITELTEAAYELLDRVQSLDDGTSQQVVKLSKDARTNRRFSWILAASIALDVVITVLLSVGLMSTHENADKINAVTKRLDLTQTVSRQKALCPLYQLFMDSKSDAARAANPRGPEAYDAAFKVIEDGYKALECDSFTGGPPTLGH